MSELHRAHSDISNCLVIPSGINDNTGKFDNHSRSNIVQCLDGCGPKNWFFEAQRIYTQFHLHIFGNSNFNTCIPGNRSREKCVNRNTLWRYNA